MFSFISTIDGPFNNKKYKTVKTLNKPKYVLLKGSHLSQKSRKNQANLIITHHYLGMINQSNFGILTNHLQIDNFKQNQKDSIKSKFVNKKIVSVINQTKFKAIPINQNSQGSEKNKFLQTFNQFFNNKIKLNTFTRYNSNNNIFNKTIDNTSRSIEGEKSFWRNQHSERYLRKNTLNHSLRKISGNTLREVITLRKSSSQHAILPYETKYIEKGVNVTGFFNDDESNLSGDQVSENHFNQGLLIGAKKKWGKIKNY